MKLLNRKVIKRTRRFDVEEYTLDKDNRIFKEYGISSSEIVSILAFPDNDHVLLEWQYRAPINRYIYEIPAGHVDKGETPLSAARRELKEETGYTARTFKHAMKFYTTPGAANELHHLYFAKGLKKGKRALESDEELRVTSVKIDNALRMIHSGKITDAKTISSLLYYWFSTRR